MSLLWSLYLRMKGWTLKDPFPYHLKKAVFIVGPHTSAWDFVVGLAIRSKLGLHHIKYLGKAELFKGPLGFFFRKLGGYPVERGEHHHLVDQVVTLFNENETFLLALSPEGTRKKVERLKTGFYYIAKKAGVPIVMAGFDFEKRTFHISEPFFTTDDEAADFARIYQFFAPLKGKIPELGLDHLLIHSTNLSLQ